MLKAVKEFLASRSAMLKKLAAAVVTTIVSYLIMAYAIPTLLSVKVVSLVGALVLGYLVYTKVALREIEKVIKGAEDVVDKAAEQIKKV